MQPTPHASKPPLWRRLLTLRVLCVALVLLLIGSAFWALVWPRGPIPISREVTFLTEPVGPDGYIDYAKALEPEVLVPAEKNAAGCYIRAAGLNLYARCLPEDVPRLAVELGIPDIDPAERLIRIREFGPDQWQSIDPEGLSERELDRLIERLPQEYERCLEAPWKSDEYPLVKDWLNANARPIALITEGANRPKFQFRPRQHGPLASMTLPLVQEMREQASVMTIHAMNRIGAGELSVAASDIDAVNSMARHMNEKPFIVEIFVGLESEAHAFNAEKALIADLGFQATVERRSTVIQQRKQFAGLVNSMNFAERFLALDLIQEVDREARGSLPPGSSFVPGPPLPAYLRRYQVRMIDTVECSRRVNQIFDETVAALQLPLGERSAALRVIGQRSNGFQRPDPNRFMSFLSSSTLNDGIIAEFRYVRSTFDESLRLQTTRQKLLDIACAARLFELANGSSASMRTDLVPRYLSEWPHDDIRGEPFEDATIDGRWRIFFRISGESNSPPENISYQSRIDIPYTIEVWDDE